MKMYGTIKEETAGKPKTVGTFDKQLRWGMNSFKIRAPKNTEIRLRLRAGGTRSGMADVGYVSVGNDPEQSVVVRLPESGAEIE